MVTRTTTVKAAAASKPAAKPAVKATAPATPAPAYAAGKSVAKPVGKVAAVSASKPVPATSKAPATKGAASKAVAKPPAPVTVTLKHLSAELAERHDLAKNQAGMLVTEMFEAVIAHIKSGDRVRIAGLGILEVRNRAARMGRNPATGEAVQIKASKKIAFRASKDLKQAI